MKQFKQSETRVIKRSQITLNAFNPKNHTDADIKQQLKNIKANGFLGGIVWNERSGALVSGHKRTLAMDAFYHYDGSAEKDYDVKVEVVDYDHKTELEQMTYMSGLNDTRPDYNLIARYLNDIDPSVVGISDEDVKQIQLLQEDFSMEMEDIDNADDLFLKISPQIEKAAQQPVTELPKQELSSEEIVQQHAEKPKMTREQVKAEKEHCDDVAFKRADNLDTFIFVDFESAEQKEMFCELLGVEPTNNMRISGKDILMLVQ